LATAFERERGLDGRERRLTTRLVYGTLQWRGQLDHHLGGLTRRGLEDVEPVVLRVLRLGAFQLLHMPEVPAAVAVHEAVQLVRALGRGRASGFVNAVLRRLAATDGPGDSGKAGDAVGQVAARGSVPGWLAERWVRRLGFEEALALALACNEVPPGTVRVQRGRTSRSALAARLAEEVEVTVEPTPRAPDGLLVAPLSGLLGSFALEEGLCVVQDEAAMLVTELLGPRPGETVLDACAAPGGKTGHIADRLAGRGVVDAVDLHPARCRQVRELVTRLGLTGVRVHEGDVREVALPCPEYDRVLLDAPCTGLGTLRRHPEVRWRRSPQDVESLAVRQGELLSAAAARVRPGGVLVYAVCSTEPEEGEEVVDAFLVTGGAGWHLEAPRGPELDGLADAAGRVRTWPHRHGLDGFFMARLRRGA